MGYANEIKTLKGITRGNQEILKKFYNKNFIVINNFILQNSGSENDSEDIFQDGLIILYQQLQSDSFTINCSVHTYFYGICKNVWRNKLRRKDKVSCCGTISDLALKVEEKIIDNLHVNERELVYRKHFLKLNCKCKEVLTSFLDGKSMQETAVMMKCSEGYARKKKFECKRKLIQMIENDPLYIELASISKINEEKKNVILFYTV